MDRLWAPWRLAYVASSSEQRPAQEGCFLCRGAAAHTPTDQLVNLVPYRTGLSMVVLNRFPYGSGHVLVAPQSHKSTLAALTPDELLDLQLTIRKVLAAIEKRMNPDGFNIGLNLGRAAGAGVPGHLHWHVVPRWVGDTNFMAVVADTRVISQALEALYHLLAEQLQTEPSA